MQGPDGAVINPGARYIYVLPKEERTYPFPEPFLIDEQKFIPVRLTSLFF
jgi:hypothetical protein